MSNSQNATREVESEESVADSTEDADTGDSILNEVQQFLERRRELAQKLREEIEATQRRLEELQETLELLQGEMGLIEEKEKKAKKAKPKPPKAATKDASEPRTKPLFGDLTAGEDERSSQVGVSTSSEASDVASGDEQPASLPNELAVD